MILASLILAASVVGPPAPPRYCVDANGAAVYCGDPAAVAGPFLEPTDPVTISLANRAIAESVAVGLTGAYDLYTTGLALSRCPTCIEGNPLGPNVETRVSMKAAGTIAAVSMIWFLESHGRRRAALGVTIGASVAQFIAGTSNAVHAARRH